MVSDIIRPEPDDPFFTAGPADYEDVKARFLEDGSTWAPQHAADVEVLLTEVTRRALRDSGESFDAALGAKLGEAYGGRFVEHLEQLEAIVRDLAGDDDDCPSTESGNCRFCRIELPAGRLDRHDPGCAWRRARAWVLDHPVSGTETTDETA